MVANIVWFVFGIVFGMLFMSYAIIPFSIGSFLKDNDGERAYIQAQDGIYQLDIDKVTIIGEDGDDTDRNE